MPTLWPGWRPSTVTISSLPSAVAPTAVRGLRRWKGVVPSTLPLRTRPLRTRVGLPPLVSRISDQVAKDQATVTGSPGARAARAGAAAPDAGVDSTTVPPGPARPAGRRPPPRRSSRPSRRRGPRPGHRPPAPGHRRGRLLPREHVKGQGDVDPGGGQLDRDQVDGERSGRVGGRLVDHAGGQVAVGGGEGRARQQQLLLVAGAVRADPERPRLHLLARLRGWGTANPCAPTPCSTRSGRSGSA